MSDVERNDPAESTVPATGDGASENVPAGSFGQRDTQVDRQGGLNQGTDEPVAMTEEQRTEYLRRQSLGNAIDDNAGAHLGGMGAQSGQVDFGSAGNLAGGIADQGRP